MAFPDAATLPRPHWQQVCAVALSPAVGRALSAVIYLRPVPSAASPPADMAGLHAMLVLAAFLAAAHAVSFTLEGDASKCLQEDVHKDVLVGG